MAKFEVLLLNAGHEASVHLTGNAVYTILHERHDPRVLFADKPSTLQTVQEVLRYCTPLHFFTRYALEDVRFENGVTVHQGQEVGLLLSAANRDPLKFANPNVFDPDRSDSGNLSLGAGIHYCLGAVLAKMELEIGLSRLFHRLPDLSIADAVSVRDSYHFHGLEALHLRW